MARDLRVPLVFMPPEGWEIGNPDAVGVPDAAFVARAPEADDGFHANILVCDVPCKPGDDLSTLARRSSLRLAGTSRIEVLDSAAGPPGEVSYYRQLLKVTSPVRGEERDLLQEQVFLDVDDPRTGFRAVVQFVLTATRADASVQRRVFSAFVRSITAGWA